MGIVNRKAMIMLMLPLILSTAQAAERFPPAYFKVTERLNNVTFTFETGLPAESEVKGEPDALTGLTRDVKGQLSIFYAYFANPADLKRIIDMWRDGEYAHVDGALQCKLVHIGTGPVVPPAHKFGIVADDCVIKALKPIK
jgi:hypothetical protein